MGGRGGGEGMSRAKPGNQLVVIYVHKRNSWEFYG